MKRIFTSLVLFSMAFAAQAQKPGTPDKSFGTGGIVRTSISGDSAGGVQSAPGGKIIIANRYFTFRRLFANGLPDGSYGNGGVATVPFPDLVPGNGRNAAVTQFIILPDGKLLAAGWTALYGLYEVKLALAQLLPDGTPDSSFGTNGTILYTFADGAFLPYANALDRQANGNIIVGGSLLENGGFHYTPFAISFLPNGTLNTAFGTAGEAIAPYNGENYDMVIQSNGSIVLGGYRSYPSTYDKINLYRLTANGQLDATFNNSDTTLLSSRSQIKTIAVQPDDKILVGVFNSPYPPFTVARFTKDGGRDAAFGNGGTTNISILTTAFTRDILVPAGAGKILITGNVSGTNPTANGVAIAAFNFDGSIDSSFGLNRGSTYSTSYEPLFVASALQSDGKILTMTTRYVPEGPRGRKRNVTEVVRLYGYATAPTASRAAGTLPAVSSAAAVTIFPNPAAGYLVVSGLPKSQKATLTVTNAAGVLTGMYSANSSSGQYRLDVSRLKPGVYFLNIAGAAGGQTLRWVKQE